MSNLYIALRQQSSHDTEKHRARPVACHLGLGSDAFSVTYIGITEAEDAIHQLQVAVAAAKQRARQDAIEAEVRAETARRMAKRPAEEE